MTNHLFFIFIQEYFNQLDEFEQTVIIVNFARKFSDIQQNNNSYVKKEFKKWLTAQYNPEAQKLF